MKPREVGLEPRASWKDVLRGKARLVGARSKVGRRDLGLTPGVISPYEVREALGLRYGDPPIEEARYERSRTRKSDLGLVARFALTRAMVAVRGKSTTAAKDSDRPFIVSSPVDALDTHEAVAKIIEMLSSGKGGLVFFVHPHALNLADSDPELREHLERADLVLPDGVGIRVAAAILGVSLPANVNGTDLIPELLLELAVHDYPVALIGGKPGVADKAAEVWKKKTKVKIAGVWHGYLDKDRYQQVAEEVGAAAPCVVLLAFGSPLQERFAVEHFAGRKGVVAITVGGLFDFTAGAKPRAPMAWRELGLEWVWRLIHEPKRLGKRYIVGNPAFLARAFRQSLR